MKTINPLLTRELVTLGYEGENEYKRVAFDISDWIRTEGAGGDVLLFFYARTKRYRTPAK